MEVERRIRYLVLLDAFLDHAIQVWMHDTDLYEREDLITKHVWLKPYILLLGLESVDRSCMEYSEFAAHDSTLEQSVSQ